MSLLSKKKEKKKKRFVISKYSKLLSVLWLKCFAKSKCFMIRICCLQWVNLMK